MKNLLVFIALQLLIASAYSQDSTLSRPLTKQELLDKSKRQRTAAWILLGAGATAIAIAAPGNVSFDLLPVLAIGGSAAILGSIPLFIAARRNKKRGLAMTADIQIQQTQMIYYGGISTQLMPGLSLKVSL
jgi:hypothetical protein